MLYCCERSAVDRHLPISQKSFNCSPECMSKSSSLHKVVGYRYTQKSLAKTGRASHGCSHVTVQLHGGKIVVESTLSEFFLVEKKPCTDIKIRQRASYSQEHISKPIKVDDDSHACNSKAKAKAYCSVGGGIDQITQSTDQAK